MRTFKVKLDGYEGEIEMRMPRVKERYECLKTISTGKEESTSATLDAVFQTIEYSMPFYVAVNIKNKKTGVEFKCLDDLDYGGDEGSKIMVDVALKLLNAQSLGEDKKKS